jgi:hypothetical protein
MLQDAHVSLAAQSSHATVTLLSDHLCMQTDMCPLSTIPATVALAATNAQLLTVIAATAAWRTVNSDKECFCFASALLLLCSGTLHMMRRNSR